MTHTICLLLGKSNKFEVNLLRVGENKVKLPSNGKKLGICYFVEGEIKGQRSYHCTTYKIDKEATDVYVLLKADGNCTVCQVIANNKIEIPEDVMKTFDEGMIDHDTTLDKAIKVSIVFANIGRFIMSIGGLVVAGGITNHLQQNHFESVPPENHEVLFRQRRSLEATRTSHT